MSNIQPEITRHTKSKKGNNPLSRNKANNITRIRQIQISEISGGQFKIITVYAKGSHGKTAEQMGNFSRDRNYKKESNRNFRKQKHGNRNEMSLCFNKLNTAEETVNYKMD